MTIRNLTAAVLLGLSTAGSPLLIQPAQAADMETQAIAEQVKARIANLDKVITQTYQRLFAHNPSIKSIVVNTSDYRDVDTGALATSTMTITLNPAYLKKGEPEDIILTVKENIIYNDALMEQDILARIDGEIVLNDNLKKLLHLDTEEANQFEQAMQYLVMTTELRPDGEVGQLIQIKPFTHEEGSDKIQFDGLSMDSVFNENTVIDGVYQFSAKFGQMTITEDNEHQSADHIADTDSEHKHQEEQHDDADRATDDNDANQANHRDTTTIYPFTIDYKLEENGDMTLNGSPLKIEYSEDDMVISVKAIKGSGSDLKFDDDIGSFTGKQEYVIDKIQVVDDTMPEPVVIDSIRLVSDTDKDGDDYDFYNEINIDVDGKSINAATGMKGLEIEDLDIKINLEDISSQAFQIVSYQLPTIVELNDHEQTQHTVQTLLTEMAQHQSALKIDTTFSTDQGDATFVANIAAKEQAINDPQQWAAAFEAPQPIDAIKLLQQSFDFNIKLTLPESLVKALDGESMMAIATGYIVKTGTDYTMHIENTDKGIELNGNLIPLPQESTEQTSK